VCPAAAVCCAQVHADFEYIGQAANLVTVCLYGGTQYNTQEMVLRRVSSRQAALTLRFIQHPIQHPIQHLSGWVGQSAVCHSILTRGSGRHPQCLYWTVDVQQLQLSLIELFYQQLCPTHKATLPCATAQPPPADKLPLSQRHACCCCCSCRVLMWWWGRQGV
jgi:hypothetical protein